MAIGTKFDAKFQILNSWFQSRLKIFALTEKASIH
jgi:hypothetical protein